MPDITDISHCMREAMPVFIVGFPRSGTSMLFNHLLHHPAFTSSRLTENDPLLALSETHIMHWACKSDRIPDRAPPEFRNFMLCDDACFNAFLQMISPVQRQHRQALPLVSRWLANHSTYGWRHSRNDLFIQAYYYYAWMARGPKRLLAKSPMLFRCLDRLQDTFPHHRAIIMLRHPVDVWSSFTKRRKKDSEAHWAHISVARFCRLYRQAARCALATPPSASLLVVRYEDFVHRPAAVMHRILEHIGEPVFEITQPSVTSASWDIDPSLFGPVVPTTKDWREYISDEEATSIQQHLSSEMRSLAFEPYTHR